MNIGIIGFPQTGKKTLFEIHRTHAAALKMQAELYTPDGRFVEVTDNHPKLYETSESGIIVGSMLLSENTFEGGSIALHIYSNGKIAIHE